MKPTIRLFHQHRLKIFVLCLLFIIGQLVYYLRDITVVKFQGNEKQVMKENDGNPVITLHTTQLRAAVLRDRCSLYKKHIPLVSGYDEHHFAKKIIVNTSLEMMYCSVPKVANTNFRRMLLQIYDVISYENLTLVSGYNIYTKYDHYFSYLSQFADDVKPNMFRRFRKFIFVRDPLERLVSGFHSKFYHPNIDNRLEFHVFLQRFYARYPWLRNSMLFKRNIEKEPLTFKEFVMYLTDMNDVGEALNEHFAPYHSLCRPCDVSYDFVGKYDSISSDTEYIFSKLGLHAHFPPKQDTYVPRASASYVAEYFKKVPAKLRLKLFNLFKMDYILFDYDVPAWLVSGTAVPVLSN